MPNPLRVRRRQPLLAALAVALFTLPAAADDNVRIVSSAEISQNEGELTLWFGDLGASLASLGDFDGDGAGDLLAGDSYSGAFLLRMKADGSAKPRANAYRRASGSGYNFAASVANVGDIDGDGVTDIAIGSPYQYVTTYNSGRVTIVFLNADGSEKSRREYDRLNGTLPFTPGPTDRLGSALAGLPDMDGDGVPELAVGLSDRESSPGMFGSVAILFLDAEADIKSAAILDGPAGGYFGISISTIGDFDGNGVVDLAVGASAGAGSLSLVYLDSDGSALGSHTIDGTTQDFSGYIDTYDRFGSAVTSLGDVDDDGVTDIAVGASGDNALYLLLLNADGSVKAPAKVSAADLGITFTYQREFGQSLALIGDLDGNGMEELATGSDEEGQFYVLFRDLDGSVLSHVAIGDQTGGIGAILAENDEFGASLAALGDVDGDGREEIAVGAPNEIDSTEQEGAVWIVSPADETSVAWRGKIHDAFAHGMDGQLDAGDRFGASVAALGDIDGNGVPDLAAGAPGDDDGGSNRGAVWLLTLDDDGSVLARHKISSTAGAFTGPLADGALFGRGVASIGDLDADGNPDIAVADGQLWVLLLTDTFTVKSAVRLAIDAASVAAPGDVDGDGRIDLAVGQPEATSTGAVQIVFLNADGTLRASQPIDQSQGGLASAVPSQSRFGETVSTVGDLDGDGTPDLGVSTVPVTPTDVGSLWILFLRPDGSVRSAREISENEGGFTANLPEQSSFGIAAAPAPDLDGDGVGDLVIGNSQAVLPSYYDNAGEIYFARLGTICDPQPRQFCLGGEKGRLAMKRKPGRNLKSSLRWSLSKGDATPIEIFGNVGGYYGYNDVAWSLCIYDGSAPQVAATFYVQQMDGHWFRSSLRVRYDDRFNGERDGVRQMQFTAGEAGETALQLRALGNSIPLPGTRTASSWLDAGSGLVVQLTNSTGACWNYQFEADSVQANTATLFKAAQ